MKKLLIIITIIFTINTAKAQLQGQEKIDSLLKELPKMKEDTNGVNLLQQLSFEYHLIYPYEGIKYGEQGLKLAEKIDWEFGKAKCYNALGVVFVELSNYSIALEYYLKSLKINEELGKKRELAYNLGNIGIIYVNQSNYIKALEYYHKALKIDKELGKKNGVSRHLVNIGVLYANKSD